MRERTIAELRELQDYYDKIEHREDEEIDYTIPEEKERKFLVQRILRWADDEEEATLMNEAELIHYIDMQDYCTEEHKIYDVTDFGKIVPIHYVGWQPKCLIEFATDDGEIVLTGYGTDH